MVLTKFRELLARVVGRLSIIAAVVLFFMTCLTTGDVVLSKLTHYNILGSYELTEMAMIVSIWIAISYFMVFRGHIRVTFFTDLMPKKMSLFWEIFTHLFGTVVLGFMIYAGVQRVQSDFGRDLRSTVLLIPTFPLAIMMVVGEIMFFILFATDTIISVLTFVQAWKPNKEPVQADTLSS